METNPASSTNTVVVKNILEACRIISNSSRIVVFTGAGISVDSGIPDFRSPGGLWEKFDPSVYASYATFKTKPELFWEMSGEVEKLLSQAKPNLAHDAIAKLEEMGKVSCVITQNIDNLHQAAGTKKIYELHGNASTAHCIGCQKVYTVPDMKQILTTGSVPKCKDCGHLLKTAVILFGEPLPPQVISGAMDEVQNCDALIMVGSSLSVAPANMLPAMAKMNQAKLIFINKEPTTMDELADIILHGKASELLPAIVKQLQNNM